MNPRPPGYEPGALTGGIDKRGDIYEDLETGKVSGMLQALQAKRRQEISSM